MHVLKGISKKQGILEFVLYDRYNRERLLRDMLSRLTSDERDVFTDGGYTDERGSTCPCIRFSPSSKYCTVGHITMWYVLCVH